MTKTCGIKFYEFCEPIPLITCLTNLTILIQKIALAIFDCCRAKEAKPEDKDSPQINASPYADFIRNKDTIYTVVRLIPLLSHFIIEKSENPEIKPTTMTPLPQKTTEVKNKEIKKQENTTPPSNPTTKNTSDAENTNQDVGPPKKENTNQVKKDNDTPPPPPKESAANKRMRSLRKQSATTSSTNETTPITSTNKTTPITKNGGANVKTEPLPPPIPKLNLMSNGGNTCYISSSLWSLIHTDKESIEEIIKSFKETEAEFQEAFTHYKEINNIQEPIKKSPVKQNEYTVQNEGLSGDTYNELFAPHNSKDNLDELFINTQNSKPKSVSPHISSSSDCVTVEESFLFSLENVEEMQKFKRHIEYKQTPEGKAFAAFVTLFNEITSEQAKTIPGTTVNTFRQALRTAYPGYFSQSSSSAQEDAYQFMQALYQLLDVKNTVMMKESHKRTISDIKNELVDVIGVEFSDPSNLQLNKDINFQQIIEEQRNKIEELRRVLNLQLRNAHRDNDINDDLSDLCDLEQKKKIYSEFYKQNHIKARQALISLYEKYQNESFNHEVPECMTLLKALKESYPKVFNVKVTLSALPSLINNALKELAEIDQDFIFNLGEKSVNLFDGISPKTTKITDWKNNLNKIELYDLERSYSIQKNSSRVCLQLKRYICNHKTQKTSKNTCTISIPEKINLKDSENKNVECNLSAVLVHSGATLGGGHYYTYLFKEGKVYKYDDISGCKEVKAEDAQKDYEKNSYMVYYKPVK